MRILLTSDWHLGKSIHGQDLHEDQKYVLDGIVEELGRGYDALIISGDVYDRAVPPSDAVDLFSSFIEEMVELGITTVIIPGNHDSPSRLDYASGILERSGIHFRCGYDRITEPVSVTDREGKTIHIYALPFVDEIHVRSLFPEEEIKTHQDATEFLVDLIRNNMDTSITSILAAHTYTGRTALRSDSERELLVGHQGLVDIDVFSGFDHVALGHLHRPQISSSGLNVHYSGSLIPYSFPEADQEKSFIRLDLIDGSFQIEKIPHLLKRNFSILEGSMNDLMDDERYEGFRDQYLSVKLTDIGLLVDIHRRLSERFPHVLEIDQPALHMEPSGSQSISREDADNPSKLFSLFLDKFRWDESENRDLALKMFEDVRSKLERREVDL